MKKIAWSGLTVVMLLALSLWGSAACYGRDSAGASTDGSYLVASSFSKALKKAISGEGVGKSLVITGVDKYSGDVIAMVSSASNPATSIIEVLSKYTSAEAAGEAAISGNSVSIPLATVGGEDVQWAGKGDYFITLIFQGAGNDIYVYAGGGRTARKYKISNVTTTIALNQFRQTK
jgi:hypothetical protein